MKISSASDHRVFHPAFNHAGDLSFVSVKWLSIKYGLLLAISDDRRTFLEGSKVSISNCAICPFPSPVHKTPSTMTKACTSDGNDSDPITQLHLKFILFQNLSPTGSQSLPCVLNTPLENSRPSRSINAVFSNNDSLQISCSLVTDFPHC